jgi:hypothetical protein
MSLVEQELLTLTDHLSSPPVFRGVRVSRTLVLYVCFVDRCLSFYLFSFGHCVVCSSSIYGFWLTLWYLQTLVITKDLLSFKCYLYENKDLIFILCTLMQKELFFLIVKIVYLSCKAIHVFIFFYLTFTDCYIYDCKFYLINLIN